MNSDIACSIAYYLDLRTILTTLRLVNKSTYQILSGHYFWNKYLTKYPCSNGTRYPLIEAIHCDFSWQAATTDTMKLIQLEHFLSIRLPTYNIQCLELVSSILPTIDLATVEKQCVIDHIENSYSYLDVISITNVGSYHYAIYREDAVKLSSADVQRLVYIVNYYHNGRTIKRMPVANRLDIKEEEEDIVMNNFYTATISMFGIVGAFFS